MYRNLQKVIQFLLAGNIAEITTLFAATLFNLPAPLLAVHILWVNLATATLPALALGVDPASKNIMKHKPVKSGTLFERGLIHRVVTQGVFVAMLTLAAYYIGASHSHSTGQTMAFCVLAFSQMLRAFNQRSNTEYIWVRAEGHNPWLWVSFAVSAALLSVSDNPFVILILINLILLFVGMFMDMTPAVLIFTPIFLPIATAQLGMDPVHFGIMMVLNLCVGLCTPPVGSVLFIGCSVAGVRIDEAIRPLLPMFVAMVVVLFLVAFIPEISLLVPRLFGL